MGKGIHVIKDPTVAKLLADENRRHILHFLRHHEMSATGLAKALKKNHSSIVHHLNLLKGAGLIEETKTEQVRNIVQPYYRSVADRFHVSYSLSEALTEDESFTAWQEEVQQRMLDGLGSFGFEFPEEKREKVKELLTEYHTLQRKAFEETVLRQGNPKELGRHVYYGLVRFLTRLKLAQDSEYREAMEELAAILEFKGVEDR
ncbi:MAG: winged helix-turn-helix transcriptional regulator [Candidatus Bathyarchaeota archaeon]|nr:MAG: winged helix-turn-helix transcriptional regulator [Candidatus Bathyarchaeota archaeon]